MRRVEWRLFLVLSFACGASSAEDVVRPSPSELLDQVRKGFETAPESAAETSRLVTLLDGNLPANLEEWPPDLLAFRAALEGLVGKHSLWPLEKYRRAQAGLARFQGLAEAHPDSVEIRMLRFSYYSQLPGFFEMRKQAELDLAILISLFERQTYSEVPEEKQHDMIRWILKNGHPAPADRRRLNALIGSSS